MKTQQLKQNPRRGVGLYLAVISIAMIVSLLGLAGLNIVRIERRQMTADVDRRIARRHANSAVELARRKIANDPNWRTTYSSGVETTPVMLSPVSEGTLSFILEDTDGNLTDSDTQLTLKGVGRVGDSVQVSRIQMVQSVGSI
ncbi:MAG: hypothetical protein KDA84_11685, partial [Planctomycetaceae bacterium]|nr:hypothetical protein [Planctomycetaceae bacterium]